jgi:hypothetical protein
MIPENDERVRNAYRAYLAAELARPEIKNEKQNLMAFFEAPQPVAVLPVLNAGFLVPALILAGLIFVLGRVQSHAPELAGPAEPIYRTFAVFMASEDGVSSGAASLYRHTGADDEQRARETAERELAEAAAAAKAALEDPVRNHMKPRVVVKRISSRVGPTLVYQKVYRETPVTIIWVFNRGGTPV